MNLWTDLGSRNKQRRVRGPWRKPLVPPDKPAAERMRWLLQHCGPMTERRLMKWAGLTDIQHVALLLANDLKVGRVYTCRGKYFLKES